MKINNLKVTSGLVEFTLLNGDRKTVTTEVLPDIDTRCLRLRITASDGQWASDSDEIEVCLNLRDLDRVREVLGR